MKYKILFSLYALLLSVFLISSDTGDQERFNNTTISLSLSIQEVTVLMDILEKLPAIRAARPDAINPLNPAYPVFNPSAAELEIIESILCQIKSSVNATIGNVTDTGSCFPAVVTVLDIDNATLDVIQWLKTIMRELRGVCP